MGYLYYMMHIITLNTPIVEQAAFLVVSYEGKICANRELTWGGH